MARENNKSDISNIRRSQLTKAAYRVVGDKGYYNFTIRDIAAEAGLSTGLVHYYFKDKQELIFTLMKEMNMNLKKYLVKTMASSNDPMDKLEIFVTQAFNLVKKEKDYFYILFDFWTQINRNERMKNANIKLFRSYRDECSKILTEGVKKGDFPVLDIEYATAHIISLVQGLIIQYVIDETAFDYNEYTRRIIKDIKNFVISKRGK